MLSCDMWFCHRARTEFSKCIVFLILRAARCKHSRGGAHTSFSPEVWAGTNLFNGVYMLNKSEAWWCDCKALYMLNKWKTRQCAFVKNYTCCFALVRRGFAEALACFRAQSCHMLCSCAKLVHALGLLHFFGIGSADFISLILGLLWFLRGLIFAPTALCSPCFFSGGCVSLPWVHCPSAAALVWCSCSSAQPIASSRPKVGRAELRNTFVESASWLKFSWEAFKFHSVNKYSWKFPPRLFFLSGPSQWIQHWLFKIVSGQCSRAKLSFFVTHHTNNERSLKIRFLFFFLAVPAVRFACISHVPAHNYMSPTRRSKFFHELVEVYCVL